MAWEIATAQSLGGRENQEDALLVAEAGSGMLLAVADGAGGHADGERASQAALQCLKSRASGPPQDAAGAKEWLAQAITEANRKVSALGQGALAPRTTVVAAWAGAGMAACCHVGDSRLYHWRSGKPVFRTRDHSVVQLLVDMKRLEEKEIRSHPDRSRLTKALGGGEGIEPAIDLLETKPGDGLVLCSDGVWEHIEDDELAAALQARDLQKEARELIDRAVSRGGADADNATLILTRLR